MATPATAAAGMDTLTVPPTANSTLPQQNILKGRIIMLDLSKGFGVIKTLEQLPVSFGAKSDAIKFSLTDVENTSGNPVDISIGSAVQFELDEYSDPAMPSAENIYVDANSAPAPAGTPAAAAAATAAAGVQQQQQQQQQQQHNPTISNKYFQSGPDSGTIQVFPSNIQPCGDTMTQGTVMNLLVEKKFGFLKTDTVKSIRFYFTKVRNVSDKDVVLGPGSVINFTIESTSAMTDDPGSIRVAMVELTDASNYVPGTTTTTNSVTSQTTASNQSMPDSNTLKIAPKTPIPQNLMHLKDKLASGTVFGLLHQKNFGFLRPKGSEKKKEDELRFYFNRIVNPGDDEVALGIGSVLQFATDGVTDQGQTKVGLVVVNKESNCPRANKEPPQEKESGTPKVDQQQQQQQQQPFVDGGHWRTGQRINTLVVLAKTHYPHWQMKMKDKLQLGKIRNFVVEKKFGYIIPDGAGSNDEDLRFYFTKLINVSDVDVMLGPGSTISFAIDGQADNGQIKVGLVEVNEESSGKKEIVLNCSHTVTKECHEREEDVRCKEECGQQLGCGKHSCKLECSSKVEHNHSKCTERIEYEFPNCGHKSPFRKNCSDDITHKCMVEVVVAAAACGHNFNKKCHEDDLCTMPCQKLLTKCQHPCQLKCGEACTAKPCKVCVDLAKEEAVKASKELENKIKELKEKTQKLLNEKKQSHWVEDIGKEGGNKAEYQTVEDKVLKFIQTSHNWMPKISKIERVTNPCLEEKFELSRLRAFENFYDEKFHGTSAEAVASIIKEGFRMPQIVGMFGRGIYFATDSSKSAQKIYTKGSNQLLLCKVLIGKSKTLNQPDKATTFESLKSEGFDSVYAPRGTKSTGGVLFDEFIVYKPEYALPHYIIHFSSSTLSPQDLKNLTSERFFTKNVKASRVFDDGDPFENAYRHAEGHFLRMLRQIDSIDIVINRDLEDKFDAKMEEFKKAKVPHKPVLAYHGTAETNIGNILKNNLNVSYAKRQVYGPGNYFSEYPDISIGYGPGLLLCKVLPGNEFVDSTSSPVPAGCHSKKVQPDASGSGYGQMLIVIDSDQILPTYVIHLKKK